MDAVGDGAHAREVSLHGLVGMVQARAAGDGIDLVASAVTPWHAVGVDALVHRLAADLGRPVRGIARISAHGRSGYVIDGDAFHCATDHDIEVVRCCAPSPTPSTVQRAASLVARLRSLARRRRDGPPLYLAAPRRPEPWFADLYVGHAPAAPPRFVLLDEGLETYFSESIERQMRGFDDAPPPPRGVGHATLDALRGAFIDRREQVDRSVLRGDGDALAPRDDVVRDYRAVLAERALDLDLPKDVPSGAALVLTSPFTAYEWMDDDAAGAMVERIVDQLLDAGLDVVLKPHPREDASAYDRAADRSGVHVLGGGFPAEDLLARLEPSLVVGYTTTTLVLAPVLFGVPSMSLVGAVAGRGHHPFLDELRSEFQRVAGGRVAFVDDVSEVAETAAAVLNPGR